MVAAGAGDYEDAMKEARVDDFEDAERSRIETLAIADITLDPEILARPVDPLIVTEYSDLMRDGVRFPPVLVMRTDAKTFLLIDGSHRLKAAEHSQQGAITCGPGRLTA
jgi:hypothetical protein